ncbi:MAG: HRDC domain-containing protein, partial [Acidimicrobiia bacterium]|nr:HRDC domain-containing protein [Acidimicrobiia bacterium]
DLQPVAQLLASDTTAVMHACGQDLEVLELAAGTVPVELFDTQVAAGFLGMATPSLSSLHERFLQKRLPKGDRLTDWLARPLKQGQLDYAASDVRYLLQIHDMLTEELEQRGRLEWAADELAEVRERVRTVRDPDEAWRKIKETRHLKPKAMGVARAVAAWRERRAAEIDQPVRFVLPDLAVVALAQRTPSSTAELKGLRGVDDRHLRGRVGESVLEAVAEGLAAPVTKTPVSRSSEPRRELRPAVALISAWVSQRARELEIDTTLLATRADIEAFVRGDDDGRLRHGWRAQVVGGGLTHLLEGEAALAFDSDNGLVLEERTGRLHTG